jgi:hypothetical protein
MPTVDAPLGFVLGRPLVQPEGQPRRGPQGDKRQYRDRQLGSAAKMVRLAVTVENFPQDPRVGHGATRMVPDAQMISLVSAPWRLSRVAAAVFGAGSSCRKNDRPDQPVNGARVRQRTEPGNLETIRFASTSVVSSKFERDRSGGAEAGTRVFACAFSRFVRFWRSV